jgi:hypothetical protein
MFPELYKPLLEVSERAAEKVSPVITRYRSGDQNLRTTFAKIVKRAGIIPWAKPFQNLRSTRETELMETYPAHVVCGWIGNSEAVARKHYLQVTDAHFEKAVVSNMTGGEGHRQGHKVIVTTQTDSPRNEANPENTSVFRGSATTFVSLPVDEITRPGLEPLPQTNGKTALSRKPGAQAGAIEAGSDFSGAIRLQLLNELQQAYKTFQRLDIATDAKPERQALGRLQDRLSDLMSELEALGQ